MKQKYNPRILVRPLNLWQDQSKEQEVRLEILPLIDVIFCILTFFILAAVSFSRQQAINLDLPSARTGQTQMDEMMVVSLDSIGQIYVEEEFVTYEKLREILENYYLINPRGLVVLNASKDVRYNEVIELLDLLRSYGGDRVALATLPLEGDPNLPAVPITEPNIPPSP